MLAFLHLNASPKKGYELLGSFGISDISWWRLWTLRLVLLGTPQPVPGFAPVNTVGFEMNKTLSMENEIR